jgi:hypothetical protein
MEFEFMVNKDLGSFYKNSWNNCQFPNGLSGKGGSLFFKKVVKKIARAKLAADFYHKAGCLR